MNKKIELTYKNILIGYSNAFKELSEGIDSEQLGSEREYKLLNNRARLISNLEIAIKYALDINQIEDETLLAVKSLSLQANRVLELGIPASGNFGLRALITSMGDSESDPNQLDLLINQI